MTAPAKRYNFDVDKFSHARAYESEHGRWVKRDDYVRLEQECEKLRADFRCPRPCNGRPEDFTASQCLEAGECGCMPAGELIRGLRAEAKAMRLALMALSNDFWLSCEDLPEEFAARKSVVEAYAVLQAKP